MTITNTAVVAPTPSAKVTTDGFDERHRLLIAVRFFHLIDAAEFAPCGSARICARQASPHVVLGQRIEMRLDLVAQLAVMAASREQRDET